jgi:hypothetical protein
VLGRECDSRNATIEGLVAQLRGEAVVGGGGLADDEDDDDVHAGDDADDEQNAPGAAVASAELIFAELRNERQNTAEWVESLSK